MEALEVVEIGEGDAIPKSQKCEGDCDTLRWMLGAVAEGSSGFMQYHCLTCNRLIRLWRGPKPRSEKDG